MALAMIRKLPIYLLVDTSASMTGRPIEIVKEGIGMLVQGLREDPRTLETAWLSTKSCRLDSKTERRTLRCGSKKCFLAAPEPEIP